MFSINHIESDANCKMGLFPNDNLCTFWDGGFPHGDFQTPSRHGFLVISTPGAQPQKFHWHWLLAMAAKGMKQWTKLRQWIPNQNLLLVICINIYIYIIWIYYIYIFMHIYTYTWYKYMLYTYTIYVFVKKYYNYVCVYVPTLMSWLHCPTLLLDIFCLGGVALRGVGP